jgi:hypothetical protein
MGPGLDSKQKRRMQRFGGERVPPVKSVFWLTACTPLEKFLQDVSKENRIRTWPELFAWAKANGVDQGLLRNMLAWLEEKRRANGTEVGWWAIRRSG